MSRRRISIEAEEDIFILRGWRGRELADQAGVKLIYSRAAGENGGWIGDMKALPDVLAYLEHRNVRYVLEDVRQPDLFGETSGER